MANPSATQTDETRIQEWNDIIHGVLGHRLLLFQDEDDDSWEPQTVLDCGFGEGSWANAVAEEFSDCQVSAAQALRHAYRDSKWRVYSGPTPLS